MKISCRIGDRKEFTVAQEGADLTKLCAQVFGAVPDDYSFEIFLPKWDKWVAILSG